MRIMSSGQPTTNSQSTTVICKVQRSNLAALFLFMRDGGGVGCGGRRV